MTKAGIRDTHLKALNRNRCYAFVAQVPGEVSVNGIAFSVPRCYCVAVWNWIGKGQLQTLPTSEWDAAGFTVPRMFSAAEGRTLCSRLTPDACIGIVASAEGKLVRYMNADMIRLTRIRDGSTREFAACIQQAAIHSLAGYRLSDTCERLSSSGVAACYVKMYRAAVRDLWESYMQEKVWRTRKQSHVKIVRCFVAALHKEYLKRIGSSDAKTDMHRVQLFLAAKCPTTLADVLMRWRERFPKAKTP